MTVNYFTNKKPKNNPLFSYLNLCLGAEPQVNVFKKRFYCWYKISDQNMCDLKLIELIIISNL